MNKHQHQSKDNNLTEGLRRADLKDMIDHLFTVDQFKSKMGDDKDIITIRFRAKDKEPAIDLMEFIEKGYEYVLDADVSSGEERDGHYSIFVELERKPESAANVKDLLNGVGQLCDHDHWRFRWYRDIGGHDFTEENFASVVPLTPEDYTSNIDSEEQTAVESFFNQGALDSIDIDKERNITFNKPFAGPLTGKLIAIGEYNTLKSALRGGLQLDESSRSQVSYLNKYLGNYDISKIENHFLIRNGDKAVILAKHTW